MQISSLLRITLLSATLLASTSTAQAQETTITELDRSTLPAPAISQPKIITPANKGPLHALVAEAMNEINETNADTTEQNSVESTKPKEKVALLDLDDTAKVLALKTKSLQEWGTSILFHTADSERLFSVLNDLEREQDNDILSALIAARNAQKEVALQTAEENPLSFPSFRLGSILYFAPGHWSIWLNGQKYTNRTSPEKMGTLRIRGVRKERVDFAWLPDDPKAIEAIAALQEQRKTASLKPQRDHRKANGVYARISPNNSAVYFSLRPNQEIEVRTLAIIEGYRKLETATAAIPATEAEAAASVTPPTTAEEAAVLANRPSEDLEDTMSKIKASKNTADAAVQKMVDGPIGPKKRILDTLGIE